MHLQRLDGVGTATRIEAAARRERGGDPLLVQPDRLHQNPCDRAGPALAVRLVVHRFSHTAPPSAATSLSRRQAASRSLPSSALDAVAAAGSARMTNALPGARVPSRWATRWRSRRETRWRTTELPTALLTTKPTRTGGPVRVRSMSGFWLITACTTSRDRPARRPCRVTWAKSPLRVSRAVAGSTVVVPPVRPTVRHGPCGDARTGSPAPRGYASAAGTRGSWRDGGCSAGRCACPCSRLSFSRSCFSSRVSSRRWPTTDRCALGVWCTRRHAEPTRR
jgi:hypothetical protein